MSTQDRLQALRILTSLMTQNVSLAQTFSSAKELSSLTKELCFGFCRHYFRLQAIAHKLMDKKPKEPEVWIVILLGLYQLEYMNKPEYAAVQESVSLLEKRKKAWAKGLANAVLRTYCRQKDAIKEKLKDSPDFLYGQPQWLLERLQKDWPEVWQKIAQENDKHPPMVLRVNQRKTNVSEYLLELEKKGIEAEVHPFATEAVILKTPCDVYSLPGFSEGYVSVQDAAAQHAVSLLSLKPGMRVLDACSAPGGKTCHILEAHPDLDLCLALDVDKLRLQRVHENLDRLGLTAKLVQGDVLTPQDWWDKLPFDRILLDAPCSATGVIRRHSDIKILRTPKEISHIIEVQKNMLDTLWPLLAPKGIMVYATCSVLADENEHQIGQFLTRHKECTSLKQKLPFGRDTGHGYQILPGEHNMDGFFYSVLVKDL